MRAKLQGKIESAVRSKEDGCIYLTLKLNGNVDTARAGDAKKATMECTFVIKQIIGDELPIGSTIYVSISNEEEAQ